jgi:hypothetical protein
MLPLEQCFQDTNSQPHCKLELLQDTQKQGNGTPRLFWEAVYISMLAATQQIHIQSSSPNKKAGLPFQAKYRSKKQNPYMVDCNFIGYFILSAMRHFSDLASLVSVSCHAGPSSLLHHSPL